MVVLSTTYINQKLEHLGTFRYGMDPLSVTASVTAILTIVVQSALITKRYVDGVRNASETAKSLLVELTTLSSNLKLLAEFLDGSSAKARVFKQTSEVLTQTTIYEKKLKKLNAKLPAIASSLARQVIWPFTEEDHRRAIQDLRAFSDWIQFCLSLDSSVLLYKSSEGISKILSGQLESNKTLDNIEHRVAAVELSLRFQNALVLTEADQKQFDQCLAKLSSIEQGNEHDEIKGPRVEGTGDWILECPEFKSLVDMSHRSPSSNVLICHGDQGAGKSVLASRIVDHLQEIVDDEPLKTNLAFFYFRRQDAASTTPLKLFGSLSKQLLRSIEKVPDSFLAKLKRAKNAGQFDLQTVKDLLLKTCALTPRTYIVVDAFDECDNYANRRSISQGLKQLAQIPMVRLCITSRTHDSEVRRDFKDAMTIRIQAQKDDIEQYLMDQIENSSMALQLTEQFRTTIIDSIASQAKQMFLLAVLQIQEVLNAPSIGEMREALKTLPASFDQAFDRTIAQIAALPDKQRRLAFKTLTWLMYAKPGQKLEDTDLCEALALRLGQESTNSENRPPIENVVDCCRGLVMVERKTKHVLLIHDAVRGYLSARRRELFPHGEVDLADYCLAYLHTEPILKTIFTTEDDFEVCLNKSYFLEYAASAWDHHVRQSKDRSCMESAIELLKQRDRRNCLLQLSQYLKGRRSSYWEIKEADSHDKLHVASHFGLELMTRNHLKNGRYDVNATTQMGTTALMKACSAGHLEIVDLLLFHGADPTLMNWYGNSLHAAAEAGQSDVIQKLIFWSYEQRTSLSDWINAPNNHGDTAVECASMGNHAAAVRKLLEFEAKPSEIVPRGLVFGSVLNEESALIMPESVDATGTYMTALSNAIAKKDFSTVSSMMQYSPKSKEGPTFRMKPLHWAAGYGNIEIVSRLLEVGIDVDAGLDVDGEAYLSLSEDHDIDNQRPITAYSFAVAMGHVAIQDLLLQYGAAVSATVSKADVDRLLSAQSAHLSAESARMARQAKRVDARHRKLAERDKRKARARDLAREYMQR